MLSKLAQNVPRVAARQLAASSVVANKAGAAEVASLLEGKRDQIIFIICYYPIIFKLVYKVVWFRPGNNTLRLNSQKRRKKLDHAEINSKNFI